MIVLLVLVMLWALLPFIAAVLFVAFLRSLAIDLKRTSLRDMADSIIMAMITAPVTLFVLTVVFGVMSPRPAYFANDNQPDGHAEDNSGKYHPNDRQARGCRVDLATSIDARPPADKWLRAGAEIKPEFEIQARSASKWVYGTHSLARRACMPFLIPRRA